MAEKPEPVPAGSDGRSVAAGIDPQSIRVHLERILESSAFRASKRSAQFLRYVVEQAVEGRTDLLRERVLGVEVFGRDPSYDTGEDAIVRLKAHDVRKRLVQYYAESGAQDSIRIELASGSYVPDFQLVARAAERVEEKPRNRLKVTIVAIAAAAGILVVAAGLLQVRTQVAGTSVLDQFWGPVLSTPEPVMICLGQPAAYQYSRRIHDEFLRSHPAYLSAPYVVTFAPNSMIRAEDLVSVGDLYVAAGDATVALRTAILLTSRGKPASLRIGNDITFTELRGAPAVLVGAFLNVWTLELTRDFRFSVRRDLTEKGAFLVIDDKVTGRDWRMPNPYPKGRGPVDYAVVSRVFESRTGRPMVAIAGLASSGSQAGGELLTDPRYLAQMVRHAPSGWQKMNLQVVVQTKVVGYTPGPPEVLATHFW